MRRDSITLQQLADRGHDVRAWCFTCGRGATIDARHCRRFAQLDLQAAASRFRCARCRTADAVALFPARRPRPAPAQQHRPVDGDRAMTSADMVAAIYFQARREAKRSKADAAAERAAERLLAHIKAPRPAPRRVPTKRPNLRIVGTPLKE